MDSRTRTVLTYDSVTTETFAKFNSQRTFNCAAGNHFQL